MEELPNNFESTQVTTCRFPLFPGMKDVMLFGGHMKSLKTFGRLGRHGDNIVIMPLFALARALQPGLVQHGVESE